MESVWILFDDLPFAGKEVVGVFANKEDAERAGKDSSILLYTVEQYPIHQHAKATDRA